MARVTRFNPTTNGDLHLGHVYMMLFNEHVAHESGGRFIVRFEDNSIDTIGSLSPLAISLEEMTRYCRQQQEAIEWMGFEVDGFVRQSEMDLELKQFVAHHGNFVPEYRFPYSIPLNPALGGYDPEQGEWFPYAPYLTFHRVIYDELAGVNVLIRGDDLRSEFALYQHYRAGFGLPEIKHYYLPRLYGPKREIVSKFHKARPVLDFKADGWTPDDIREALAQSALREPSEGWRLDNVKQQPRLIEAFSITLGVHDSVSVGRTDDFIWGD